MDWGDSTQRSNLYSAAGNTIYDVATGLQTILDPNAAEIDKANAINNVVAAVANITQIGGDVIDASPQTMQILAAAGLTTSFANVGTSLAQLTDINFKYQNGQASFNDLFMSIVNTAGAIGGLTSNIGAALNNPEAAFWGGLIQTYTNALKEINEAAINGVDPITGLRIPNIFEWLTDSEYRKEYSQYLEDLFPGSHIPSITPGSIDTRSCHPPINTSQFNGFNQSKSYHPPRDPLALDLDGDGIETVATSAGVLFDHNADGIATGTGWVKSDDGLLVRDINGNGIIDSGRELFGDQTKLSSGATAATGYAALRDLDSNADGKIDASDAAFGELKIWRDLNQDGISQMNELSNLADVGIASLNLDTVVLNRGQNGNTIVSTGTYTKTDGSTGTSADVNLAIDTVNRRFTDPITVPEPILALPDMQGSGRVRDLQEAASLSTSLQDVLTLFSSAATHAEQMALLDELLLKWSDTSDMAKSLDERDSSYRVEYLSFGNVRRSDHLNTSVSTSTITTETTNANNPLIDDSYRSLITQWNNKLHVLEAFNGSYFFGLPGQPQDGGAASIGMWVDYSGSTALFGANKTKPGLVINYAQPQLDMLNQAYESLRQAVYESLILQTRLKGYLDKVDLSITDTAIALDFSTVTQAFQEKIAADPVNGITDLIEFNKYTKDLLTGTPWDGVTLLGDAIRSQSVTTELQALYTEFNIRLNGEGGSTSDDIILGDETGRTLYGGYGNDTLLGGTGDEIIIGGAGNDTLSGGEGTDRLQGEAGDDSYVFRRGYGSDTIVDAQGNNTILFSGLTPADVTVINVDPYKDKLVFRINDTGETLTLEDQVLTWWGSYTGVTTVNRFVFADGTVWDRNEAMTQSLTKPTDGDDLIIGNRTDDRMQGLAGNDILIGGAGDDILDGGAGDDVLVGSGSYGSLTTPYSSLNASDNDTYLFGWDSGHDTILDYDWREGNNDTIRFDAGVTLNDLRFSASAYHTDLKIILGDGAATLTVKNWFAYNSPYYKIERLEFADGTVIDSNYVESHLSTDGTEGDDILSGSLNAEIIRGYGGNDRLISFGGADILDGGAGDDELVGGYGNATYRFGRGYGHDIVSDEDYNPASADVIEFTADVLPEDVIVRRSGENMVFIIQGTDDRLTVKNGFYEASSVNRIEEIRFANGVVWGYEILKTLALQATAGDDVIEGSIAADLLDGLGGNDQLAGGTGSDTYSFGRGSGQDVISETYTWGDIDTVEFQAGITTSDVVYSLDKWDLLIQIKDTPDTLRITGGTRQIERFVFADGVILTANDVEAIVGTPSDGETLIGTIGNDILVATDLNSTILGLQGNDTLSGAGGDDLLDGGEGDDLLIGGAGRDTLIGGSGANTYRLERGDGLNFLVSRVADGIDEILEFGAGITAADLLVQLDTQYGENLLPGEIGHRMIVVGIGGDDAVEIRLEDWSDVGHTSVRRFRFADSSELTLEEIVAMAGEGTAGRSHGWNVSESLTGSKTDDQIQGYGGSDIIRGQGGNDALHGGSGNDVITGDSGDDYLDGGYGDDILVGGKGDDYLTGNIDNWYSSSSAIADTDVFLFNRGDGHDYLYPSFLESSSLTLSFGAGIGIQDVSAYVASDGTLELLIDGGAGGRVTCPWFEPSTHMEISGFPSINNVQFVNADGTIQIYSLTGLVESHENALRNADSTTPLALFDNAGDFDITLETLPVGGDLAVAYAQTGDLFGTASYATANSGTESDDIVFGTPTADTLNGGGGNDLMFGSDGDDNLDGGTGNDRIAGGAGDDTIHGGGGRDFAFGGNGSDTYIFNAGDGILTIEDYYFDKDATSIVSDESEFWGPWPVPPTIDTSRSSNILQLGPGITYEDLRFSAQDGYLVINIPTSGDQIRLSRFNPDRATFSDAIDIIRFSDGMEVRYDDPITQGISTSTDNDGAFLEGTVAGDIITGGLGDDSLTGGQGNDWLVGGDGDDTYYFNLGDGVDTITDISGTEMGNSVVFGVGITPDIIQPVIEDGTLVLRVGDGGDAIRFEGFDPRILGMPQPVSEFTFWDGSSMSFMDLLEWQHDIIGTPGRDTLFGTSDADVIRGLGDNDQLAGGAGHDVYVFAQGDGQDIIDDLAAPGQENLVVLPDGSSPETISLSLDATANTLILTERATNNIIHLLHFDRTKPLESYAVGNFQFGSNGPTLTYAELLARGFDIVGSDGNDDLVGTALTDRIHGGSGDDIVNGGRGNDMLYGEGGDDTYIFNVGDGVVTIDDSVVPGEGNRLSFGPGISPVDMQRHLRFEPPQDGGRGMFIIGFDNGDEVRLVGFDPDDVDNSAVSVALFQFDDGSVLSFAELAQSTFVIEGNNLDNVLSGTSLGDRLYGYDGSDILSAKGGSDVLTGGMGNDTLSGGSGRDTYVFNLGDGADTIIDTADNDGGNIISFGPGITRNDLSFSLTGNTLTISYGAYGDVVQVLNFDPTGVNGTSVIDTFEFSDGTIVS